MRRTAAAILITGACILAIFSLPAQANYSGGSGEPNDPYLIADANNMQAIGANTEDFDKHFLLTADIDLSSFDGHALLFWMQQGLSWAFKEIVI